MISLDIQKIAIGGSVGLAEGYLPLVEKYLQDFPSIYCCEIESAKFGQDAGLIGAAYWVKDVLLISLKEQFMAKSGNVLNRIVLLYQSLTKSEKKLLIRFCVRLICIAMSLSEIAKTLRSGRATLVRFCRTVGFKGFSDFKLELSIELATKDNQDESVLETEIMLSDDLLTIAQNCKPQLLM